MRALVCIFLLFASQLSAKVYDCFMFFNELEILKIRLAELDPVVDYFVIVEAEESHQGRSKPLYFQENAHLFAPYLHKIITYTYPKHPRGTFSWNRERWQRDAIVSALASAAPDDLILISDCDEIPRKEAVLEMEQILKENSVATISCHQNYYSYFLNSVHEYFWIGTVATARLTLDQITPSVLRDLRFQPTVLLSQSGWHFSSMGGDEAVRNKLANFAHFEMRGRQKEVIDNFKKQPIVSIDETFPEYVRTHIEELTEKGFIYPCSP